MILGCHGSPESSHFFIGIVDSVPDDDATLRWQLWRYSKCRKIKFLDHGFARLDDIQALVHVECLYLKILSIL